MYLPIDKSQLLHEFLSVCGILQLMFVISEINIQFNVSYDQNIPSLLLSTDSTELQLMDYNLKYYKVKIFTIEYISIVGTRAISHGKN